MGKAQGLLWKINSGTKTASYLFGTMHSAGDVATNKVKEVFSFIRTCTHYFGESDIDQLMTKPFQPPMVEWKGLKSVLSPSAYAKSALQLNHRFGLDLDPIQHLPPMFLTALISEKMMAANSGPALDVQLWNLAKSFGLNMNGLESVNEQSDIYAKIPLTYQIRQLKKFLLNLSGAAGFVTKIENAYARDNLSGLYRLTHKHLGKTKRVILYDRNYVMAQRIKTFIDTHMGTVFFALGAAHLPGHKGVLRWLKHIGLRLEPIRQDFK